MHLHFIIEQACELKSHGTIGFLKTIMPFAMWRDVEEQTLSFADHRSKMAAGDNVGRLSAWSDPGSVDSSHMVEVKFQLPRVARRRNDPLDGGVTAKDLVDRARRAIEKGSICTTCPAAATNPERFGCWVPLVLPPRAPLVEWIMKRWLAGCRKAGRTELAWLTRLHGKRGAAFRLLLPPEERSAEAAAARTVEFIQWGRREELSVDVLLASLMNAPALEARHQLALLRDFDCMQPEELDRIAVYRKDKPNLAVPWDASPILLQPEPADSTEILAFKSLLYACYHALHLGRPITIHPVSLEEPAPRPSQ